MEAKHIPAGFAAGKKALKAVTTFSILICIAAGAAAQSSRRRARRVECRRIRRKTGRVKSDRLEKDKNTAEAAELN